MGYFFSRKFRIKLWRRTNVGKDNSILITILNKSQSNCAKSCSSGDNLDERTLKCKAKRNESDPGDI
jgi:hypothetical protein